MNLSTQVARAFEGEVRARGNKYYVQCAATIREGTAHRVTAVVRGSRNRYEVEIEWEGGDLSLYCECPYFGSDGPCEHLWATVLEAESRGLLSAVENIRDIHEVGLDDIGFNLFDDEPETPPRWAFIPPPKQVAPLPKVPQWKKQMLGLSKSPGERFIAGKEWPEKRQILYIVDLSESASTGETVIWFHAQDRKMNGAFGMQRPLRLDRNLLPQLPAEDRAIFSAITGGTDQYGYSRQASGYGSQISASCMIPHPLAETLVPMIVRTGRCYLGSPDRPDRLALLEWSDAGAWRFGLRLREGTAKNWLLEGVFRRGEESLQLSEVSVVTKGGMVFGKGKVSPLAEDARLDWMKLLSHPPQFEVPEAELHELLEELVGSPGLPELELPESLQFETMSGAPRPCLRIESGGNRFSALLSFAYEERQFSEYDRASGFMDAESRRFVRRDAAAEKLARQFLLDGGAKALPPSAYEPTPGWEILVPKLPALVRRLVEGGWHLDADGKVFRRPGAFKLGVSSGVDWFELQGEVEYGETSAKLPALLEAMRRGESMVRLDDGTYGVLPEEWLRRIGMLTGMGTAVKGEIRFRKSQAGLLDALLASQPEATFDETFARIRNELKVFEGVKAVAQPPGFKGQLRDYQCEGLGWMEFLRRFSFGGCLADDMGVGKTAQVLAMLEGRRGKHGPSLVVMPKSLIFNWKQEAGRFTPEMRVLDYTGLGREFGDFTDYDLVVTTYGTLRRDAVRLKDVAFDYVVLDEAQAVKNAGTESAKAVRLLQSRHRLALSGTPVENHLGELWSLFEFLNPGMLGAASVFQLTSGGGKTMEPETRALLAHALRPFILRRTKDQVVKELPAKTEQTVYCEMEPAQRKLYDELKKHYRDGLRQRIETDGLAKSKIMVLEALLRLRQAACHPGLIDAKRVGEPSAKLEALEEQLREVMETGHKAIVFSQFTSFLGILRGRLDKAGVVYEYLDGKTRDRQGKVERFQGDPDCKLFLISLKAGGLGLNLTAAEYVFLLDPWWNPAVEAQAVDRAHRIGQQRPVFAYRLIARDTVEEKVLELQRSKRDLAASIIQGDNSLIRDLKREDLELLLS